MPSRNTWHHHERPLCLWDVQSYSQYTITHASCFWVSCWHYTHVSNILTQPVISPLPLMFLCHQEEDLHQLYACSSCRLPVLMQKATISNCARTDTVYHKPNALYCEYGMEHWTYTYIEDQWVKWTDYPKIQTNFSFYQSLPIKTDWISLPGFGQIHWRVLFTVEISHKFYIGMVDCVWSFWQLFTEECFSLIMRNIIWISSLFVLSMFLGRQIPKYDLPSPILPPVFYSIFFPLQTKIVSMGQRK